MICCGVFAWQGGTLVDYEGKLRLVEIAQVPKDKVSMGVCGWVCVCVGVELIYYWKLIKDKAGLNIKGCPIAQG